MSDRLGGSTGLGMLGEGLGTFFLVFTIVAVAVNPEGVKAWAGLAIGASLGFGVLCIAPLTGASSGAWKPQVRCDPSQNGRFFDCPQRHSATTSLPGGTANSLPR